MGHEFILFYLVSFAISFASCILIDNQLVVSELVPLLEIVEKFDELGNWLKA